MKRITFLIFLLNSFLFSQSTQEHSAFTRTSSLSINPLFLPFGTIHVEYDHTIGISNVTIGAASWLEYRDIKDNWFHIRAMYHTSDDLFRGFSVGLTGGIHRSTSNDIGKLKEDSAPVAGGVVHYNWLLGNEERLLVGTGIGAEVPLKQKHADSPIPTVNANLRIVVGWLF